MPARTECHLIRPNAKSTTAQIEKKSSELERFIHQHYAPTVHNREMILDNVNLHRGKLGYAPNFAFCAETIGS